MPTHRFAFRRWTALAIVLAPLVACGGNVIVDADTPGAPAGAGGSTTQSGSGGGTMSGGGTCNLTTSGVSTGSSSGPDVQRTECFAVPATGKCPSQYHATTHIIPSLPCAYLKSIDCGPVVQGGQCCYVVTEEEQGCTE